MSKQKPYLRVIGDAHNLITHCRNEYYSTHTKNGGRTYVNVAQAAEYSIQLGDMSFTYDGLEKLDDQKHVFLGGNHDNYDRYHNIPHALGDYGMVAIGNIVDAFFIRGAFSIDWSARTTGYNHWLEEELNNEQMDKAFAAYKASKSDIMFTHTCPTSVARKVNDGWFLKNWGYDPKTFTSATGELLEACLNEWQPRLWFFGHLHRNIQIQHERTTFICLDELCYQDLDNQGNLVYNNV